MARKHEEDGRWRDAALGDTGWDRLLRAQPTLELHAHHIFGLELVLGRLGHERLEGRLQLRQRCGREGGAHAVWRDTAAQVADEGVRVLDRRALQKGGELACPIDKGLIRLGGQRHREDLEAEVDGLGHARPCDRGLVLLHDAVAVGPSESKRVDPDEDGLVAQWERFGARLHLHALPLPRNLGVRALVMRRHRCKVSLLEHDEDLEERACERGGLHVTYVGACRCEAEER